MLSPLVNYLSPCSFCDDQCRVTHSHVPYEHIAKSSTIPAVYVGRVTSHTAINFNYKVQILGWGPRVTSNHAAVLLYQKHKSCVIEHLHDIAMLRSWQNLQLSACMQLEFRLDTSSAWINRSTGKSLAASKSSFFISYQLSELWKTKPTVA